jgi:D-alanyl-D-alanine carboxypeptidase/D-alanyl-D-alanine-endopeptidase (penicillin-binding protein 4)
MIKDLKASRIILIIGFSLLLTGAFPPENIAENPFLPLQKRIGQRDSALIATPSEKIVFSKNADKYLVPASTLKIFTALLGLHILGPDFRFQTDFYLDNQSNLTIKGYGDPLLVSEVVDDIAQKVSMHVKRYHDLILDDSFFSQPLQIPGITSSYQPYDAPNGALCVNFNTVYFKKTDSGKYMSAETQTPLIPFVRNKIIASKLKKGRIIFSQEGKEIVLYAGHLFQYFFKKAGMKAAGKIRIGRVSETNDRMFYRYASRFPLKAVISKLMEHSNNFMANQILIAAGASAYGSPGSLAKGVKTGRSFANEVLKIKNLQYVEGSGISRKNRMSANIMFKVLKAFHPYHDLLRYKDGVYFKTGTLSGVSTRAGYIESTYGDLFPFVVLLNSKGTSAEKLMDVIKQKISELK